MVEDQLARWKKHFQEVLNRPTSEQRPQLIPGDPLDINIGKITKDKIHKALSSLKNGRPLAENNKKAIKHIRKCLTFQPAQNLAFALIISRLDYCNSILYSLSSTLIRKLQKIQNHIARIVLNCGVFTLSTQCLDKLH